MKLKLNNIGILYAITFFAALYFYHPIATLYYQARGLSFVEINSLWAIIVGVMTMAEVPTGILADKIGRKFSIIVALFLQLAGGIIAKDLQMDSFILKEPISKYRHSEESLTKPFKDGIRLLKTNKSLQRIVILSLLVTPFVNYLMTFYQPYFVEAEVGGVWFGVALSIASLLGILTSKYAYLLEKYFGVKRGVLITVLLPGIFYFLITVVYHPWISILLFILAYASMHLQKPICTDYTNRHIKSKNRATVLSIINMFSGIYVAGMGIIIGLIADYKLNYGFIFMGSIIIVVAFALQIEETHVSVSKE